MEDARMTVQTQLEAISFHAPMRSNHWQMINKHAKVISNNQKAKQIKISCNYQIVDKSGCLKIDSQKLTEH